MGMVYNIIKAKRHRSSYYAKDRMDRIVFILGWGVYAIMCAMFAIQ